MHKVMLSSLVANENRSKFMAKLRIKEIAQAKGMNQSRLQIKSGVTPPLLHRYWHNRIVEVKLEALEKIAKALGVKPGDLIVSDEDYMRENINPSRAPQE